MAEFQKIKTFLWYDKEAEEAANYYVAAFKNSKVDHIERLGDIGPKESGSVTIVEFTLAGQQFVAMNAGPTFKFNNAISMFVLCEDQAEVDRLWTHLLAGGGKEQACGWLNDKFGLSWQIVPEAPHGNDVRSGQGQARSRHRRDDADGEVRHRRA